MDCVIAKFMYVVIWNFYVSPSGLKMRTWSIGLLWRTEILTFTFSGEDELCRQQNVWIHFLIGFSRITNSTFAFNLQKLLCCLQFYDFTFSETLLKYPLLLYILVFLFEFHFQLVDIFKYTLEPFCPLLCQCNFLLVLTSLTLCEVVFVCILTQILVYFLFSLIHIFSCPKTISLLPFSKFTCFFIDRYYKFCQFL